MPGLQILVQDVGWPFLIAFVLFGLSGFLFLAFGIPFINRYASTSAGRPLKRSGRKETEGTKEPEPVDTRTAVFSIGSIQETPEGRPLIVGSVEKGTFSVGDNVQLSDKGSQPVGTINASILTLRSLTGQGALLKEGESGMLELGGVQKDQVSTRMEIEK